jgi:hypothetical protein
MSCFIKSGKKVKPNKMDKHEHRYIMKFFFLKGKRHKEIYGELTGILTEAAVSLATVKH